MNTPPMPDYRRCRIPGGTFFFTVTLLNRRSDALVRHIESLREAVRATRSQRPFHIDGWVVLPDHLHCLWTLPEGDSDYSNRWKSIKIRFVQSIDPDELRSVIRAKRGERAIWQRRFWEHAIRDQADYFRHLDYIHCNLVKHGWVKSVKDWPFSTYRHLVRMGVYPEEWAANPAEDFGFGERDEGGGTARAVHSSAPVPAAPPTPPHRSAGLGERPMHCDVVAARPLRHMEFSVTFADGLTGRVRLEPSHLQGVFEPLRDPLFVNQLQVRDGFVF